GWAGSETDHTGLATRSSGLWAWREVCRRPLVVRLPGVPLGDAQAHRRTDLVGDGHRDHSSLERYGQTRRRFEHEATEGSPSGLDWQLQLGAGQAHGFDTPRRGPEDDVAVAFDPQPRSFGWRRLVAAVAQSQQVDP